MISLINETPTKNLSSICCLMKSRTARKTSSASCCTFTATPDNTGVVASSSPHHHHPLPHHYLSHHPHLILPTAIFIITMIFFFICVIITILLTSIILNIRVISLLYYIVWRALTSDVLSVQTVEEVLVGGRAGRVSDGPQDPLQLDWHVIQNIMRIRRIPPWSKGHSRHVLNHMKTYGCVRRWNMTCGLRRVNSPVRCYLSRRTFSSDVAMKDWRRALTQQVSP